MADCLMYLIDRAVCEPDILRRMHEKPIYGDEFAQVKLLDRRDGYERAKICCGAFPVQIRNYSVWRWMTV